MIWVYNEPPPSLLPPLLTVKYKTKLSVFSQNSSPGCLPPGIIILYLKSHFISPCILFQSQVAATAPTPSQTSRGTKHHILLRTSPALLLSEHGNLGLFHFPQKLHIKIVWSAMVSILNLETMASGLIYHGVFFSGLLLFTPLLLEQS